jgi:hypothetical protein
VINLCIVGPQDKQNDKNKVLMVTDRKTHETSNNSHSVVGCKQMINIVTRERNLNELQRRISNRKTDEKNDKNKKHSDKEQKKGTAGDTLSG